ncbi:hypothetical protein PLICRDRAFT_95588 [Plicaturopsis crispa FD-325 SS-3]|uniref:Uncharacterized protein n=1 Tax=Plicaturopsis crispa FD-325 SS-3 TaxID=944288 RepID=A0A0C9SQK7_PLICR|nr:hypothetical protein PLICRDRAFT_95588 [Plicaturopsis crispa FD-325 SS-3]
MDSEKVLALGVLVAYFLLIFLLFWIILESQPRATRLPGSVYLFGGLTAISFAHTWFSKQWSFQDYETSSPTIDGRLLVRVANWLVNTGLFEQAWSAVCSHPLNWWWMLEYAAWSEQLCLFTVGAWTLFLATEGRHHSIKHLWAYMLLGQVVAISVASNLFYLALVRSSPAQRASKPRTASLAQWLSVIVSLVTIGLSPYTSAQTFLPNLLVMHALLLVPLLPFANSASDKKFGSIRLRSLYTIIVLLSAVLRTRTVIASAASFSPLTDPGEWIRALRETLHAHPAQSSIGWDVVWTSISFFAWRVGAPWAQAQATVDRDAREISKNE